MLELRQFENQRALIADCASTSASAIFFAASACVIASSFRARSAS
jgi:hypothetical protein